MTTKKMDSKSAVAKQTAISRAATLAPMISYIPPEGFFSAKEFATDRCVGISKARMILNKLVAQQQLDTIMGSTIHGGSCMYYGFKDEVQKKKRKGG